MLCNLGMNPTFHIIFFCMKIIISFLKRIQISTDGQVIAVFPLIQKIIPYTVRYKRAHKKRQPITEILFKAAYYKEKYCNECSTYAKFHLQLPLQPDISLFPALYHFFNTSVVHR